MILSFRTVQTEPIYKFKLKIRFGPECSLPNSSPDFKTSLISFASLLGAAAAAAAATTKWCWDGVVRWPCGHSRLLLLLLRPPPRRTTTPSKRCRGRWSGRGRRPRRGPMAASPRWSSPVVRREVTEPPGWFRGSSCWPRRGSRYIRCWRPSATSPSAVLLSSFRSVPAPALLACLTLAGFYP